MTLAEKRTDFSVPLRETESIFPQSATRVMAIMRIDHSRAGSVVSPSNSLNRPGAARSSIALSPKTVAPVASTLRRYELFCSVISFIMASFQRNLWW